MVRVWYLAADEEVAKDPRLPHHINPKHEELLDLDTLYEKTCIEYFKIDADNFEKDATLWTLHKERHYQFEDHLILDPKSDPNIEREKTKYFTEHLHEDQEIRLFISGSGYFDARDLDDRWIRIELEKKDMIVLPAGIYHRFTMDTKEFATINRYFTVVPRWTAHYRPADDHPSRKKYLAMMAKGAPKRGKPTKD